MALHCDFCGARVKRDEIDVDPDDDDIEILCPSCQSEQRDRRWAFRKFQWLLLVIGLGIIAGVWTGAAQIWIWVNLSLCLLWSLLLVFPHELAHALTARAVGWRVPAIDVGSGWALAEWKMLGMHWNYRSPSGIGFCHVVPTSLRWYRLKDGLVTAAGPLSHVALAAAALFLIPDRDPFRTDITSLALWPTFIIVNAIHFFANMLPVSYGDDELPSDGLTLLTLPFRSDERCREELMAAHLEWGDAELEYGNYEEARRIFENLLRQDPLDDDAKVIALAQLALLDVIAEDPESAARRLDGVDGRGEAKFYVDGARGALELARGNHKRGEKLLKSARRASDDRSLTAIYRCFLARAAEAKGKTGESESHYRAARRADAECRLLP